MNLILFSEQYIKNKLIGHGLQVCKYIVNLRLQKDEAN